jgi:DNA-directed RNA polymerase subunit RPC12/RpoP
VLGLDDIGFKLAAKEWNDAKSVSASDCCDLLENDDDVFPETYVSGGSNSKSCAICWSVFGMLNRKHKCRATRKFLCHECSSKRLVRSGKQYRVSDGQYLRAAAELAGQEKLRLCCPGPLAPTSATGQLRESTGMERHEVRAQSDRDTLFDGMFDIAAGVIFGSGTPDEHSAATVSQLASTLNETRNALIQRGDRLNQLGDKSADLVDASESFSKMAKELAKKSEQGLFW